MLGIRTFKVATILRRIRHSTSQKRRGVARHHGQEADARRVHRRMGQVAIVERDQVRLEERIPETPAEQRPVGRCVRRCQIICHTRRGIPQCVLHDEVTGIDRELLARYLER